MSVYIIYIYIHIYMGVPNIGIPYFRGPHNEDYSIWSPISGNQHMYVHKPTVMRMIKLHRNFRAFLLRSSLHPKPDFRKP